MAVNFSRAGRPVRSARTLFREALAPAAALALLSISGPAQARWVQGEWATQQPSASPAAISAALRSSNGGSREVRAFYKSNGYRPIWTAAGSVGSEAEMLLDLIRTAHLDGLNPDRYRPSALADAMDDARGGSPKQLARAELLLSRGFAEYARDMRSPRDVGIHYVDRELVPTAPNPRSILAAAAAAPSLRSHIATMGWMHPLYGGLRRALGNAGQSRPARARAIIPSGETLRLGDSGERVALLRRRLALPPGVTFDEQVDQALRNFQSSSGLPQDGLAGPRTIAALNGGATQTADPQALRINLERARALPANRTGRYVLVDVASARLWMYENGEARDSMKVVVGKPSEQTPMMAGLIRFASVNPYWNIPPDLVRKRIATRALSEGPQVLRGRYEVLSGWTANPRVLDPRNVDWNAVSSGAVELPVRQLPGSDNAMGRMKFMLPNTLGIYLHDTPEKELFRKSERRFSSGCVRVEDASRLARWLFRKPLNISAKGTEKQVDLPEAVPVYITYLTAMPEGGHIVYRGDPYGRDAVQMARR